MNISRQKFKSGLLLFEKDLGLEIRSISISSQSENISCVTASGSFHLFDYSGQEIINYSLPERINYLSADNTGHVFALASLKSVYYINRAGKLLLAVPYPNIISSLDMVDGSFLSVVGQRNNTAVLMTKDGSFHRFLEVESPTIDVAADETGHFFAVVSSKEPLTLFNRFGNREWCFYFSKPFKHVSISSDGEHIVCEYHNQLFLFSTTPKQEWGVELKYPLIFSKISGDGNWILCGSQERIIILNLDSDTVWDEPINYPVTSCDISKDGSIIAAGCINGILKVYQLSEPQDSDSVNTTDFIDLSQSLSEDSTQTTVLPPVEINPSESNLNSAISPDISVQTIDDTSIQPFPDSENHVERNWVFLTSDLLAATSGENRLFTYKINSETTETIQIDAAGLLELSDQRIDSVTFSPNSSYGVIDSSHGLFGLNSEGKILFRSKHRVLTTKVYNDLFLALNSDGSLLIFNSDGKIINNIIFESWLLSYTLFPLSNDRIQIGCVLESGFIFYDLSGNIINSFPFTEKAIAASASPDYLCALTRDGTIQLFSEGLLSSIKITATSDIYNFSQLAKNPVFSIDNRVMQINPEGQSLELFQTSSPIIKLEASNDGLIALERKNATLMYQKQIYGPFSLENKSIDSVSFNFPHLALAGENHFCCTSILKFKKTKKTEDEDTDILSFLDI